MPRSPFPGCEPRSFRYQNTSEMRKSRCLSVCWSSIKPVGGPFKPDDVTDCNLVREKFPLSPPQTAKEIIWHKRLNSETGTYYFHKFSWVCFWQGSLKIRRGADASNRISPIFECPTKTSPFNFSDCTTGLIKLSTPLKNSLVSSSCISHAAHALSPLVHRFWLWVSAPPPARQAWVRNPPPTPC